jgi:hypothetical protein
MRKTLIAASAAIALAGCDPSSTTASLQEIQQATLTACAFLPTAVQIAGELSSASNVTKAEDIAAIICAAAVKRSPAVPAGASGFMSARPGTSGDVTFTVRRGKARATVTGHFVGR